MSYDWIAALVFLASLVLLTLAGRFLAFEVPSLQRMRELNREADARKMSRKRFREAVEVNNRTGLVTNVVFYATVLPFCVNLEPRPLWRHVVDVVAVLIEMLAPGACDFVSPDDPTHICHPDATPSEPEQPRRLLGPGYTIACDPRVGNDCVAVREGVGRTVSQPIVACCTVSLPSRSGTGSGTRSSARTLGGRSGANSSSTGGSERSCS